MSVENEMDVVCAALRNEPDYYYAWQANIAMAFKDEWARRAGERKTVIMSVDEVHEVSNTAAKNFINLLIRK